MPEIVLVSRLYKLTCMHVLNEYCLKDPKGIGPFPVQPTLHDMPSNDDALFGHIANGPRNGFNHPQEESVEEAVL